MSFKTSLRNTGWRRHTPKINLSKSDISPERLYHLRSYFSKKLRWTLEFLGIEKLYTAFCWSAIVSIALSGTVFELFDVEWYHGLETWVSTLKVIQIGTIRKLGCGFLFAFHSNYGSILHHLRDKMRYCSKIVIFSSPLAFDAPVTLSPSEYCPPFGMRKLEWWGYPTVKKIWRYV